MHLGACTDTTERDEGYLFRNNVQYSERLLRWALARRVPFVYASSAAVYGHGPRFGEEPAHEAPLTGYGRSKWLFDQRVRAALPAASGQVVGLRYFNVYGPGEAHKGAMASIVFHLHGACRAGRPARLFGASHGWAAGEQRRDFVHVADIVAVTEWFLEHPARSGIFNVGTGTSASFNELARLVLARCGGAGRDRSTSRCLRRSATDTRATRAPTSPCSGGSGTRRPSSQSRRRCRNTWTSSMRRRGRIAPRSAPFREASPMAMTALIERLARLRVLVVGDAMLDGSTSGGRGSDLPGGPCPRRARHRHDRAPRRRRKRRAECRHPRGRRRPRVGGGRRRGGSAAAGPLRGGRDRHGAGRSLGRPVDDAQASRRRAEAADPATGLGTDRPARARDAQALLDGLADAPRPDALVLSDYAKGCLTPAVLRAVIARGRGWGIPVVVDPRAATWTATAGRPC